MSVSAGGTGDEDGAVVIALLGNSVGRTAATGDAGEGEFVGRFFTSVWWLGSVCGGGRRVCVP